jgi:hypothetical protein
MYGLEPRFVRSHATFVSSRGFEPLFPSLNARSARSRAHQHKDVATTDVRSPADYLHQHAVHLSPSVAMRDHFRHEHFQKKKQRKIDKGVIRCSTN